MADKFHPTLLARMIEGKREYERLSLREVAALTGVSPATICRMEQGKCGDIDSIVAVCEWLGSTVDAFVEKSGREE